MVWAIWEDAMTESVSAVPAHVTDAAIGRVLDDLLLVGRSGDQLAAWLSNAGCWGYPSDPRTCPVAHYLRQRLPLRDVYVRAGSITLQLADDRRVSVYTDPAVEAFIAAFDNRRYPELIAGPGLPVAGAVYPPAQYGA